MQYPLIAKDLLVPLRLSHGVYNLCMLLLFLYQGYLGLAIRRARRAHTPLPFPSVRRHRKNGPFLAGLGMLGYFYGLVLVLIDTGNVFEYTPHFLAGSLVVLALFWGMMSSDRIRGLESPYRNRHFASGILILCLYALNSLFGLGVLL